TDAQKEEVKAVNSRLSEVTTQFSQKLVEATNANALVVADAAALAGLSESEIAAARNAAADRGLSGQYLIPLQDTTQQPALATRQVLFEDSVVPAEQACPNHTRALLAAIVQLCARQSALFGEPDWASYTMDDSMAQDPKSALDFTRQFAPALAATQRRVAAML